MTRFVVCDSDDVNRSELVGALKGAGFAVVVVADPCRVLDELQADDVVLLHDPLPEGCPDSKAIAGMAALDRPNIRTVLMSAEKPGVTSITAHILEIRKPFAVADLLAALDLVGGVSR